ncbi:hypothetical protein [Actinacidiphila bryophytorum]|uniref:hypothetical protein n=1 Tax=Actinacidiphila bryophytorum TaxID=1436133 RepID=UPI002176D267|nr:hypothetical protein [Actinacidiphila bryophytorum]UWE10208.1 hypothetical protein NYE86_16805 [Actinacidiphila bryophytorum]
MLRATLRAAASGVHAGRLVAVLAPAADVVDQEQGAEDVVLQLRVLVDALWPTEAARTSSPSRSLAVNRHLCDSLQNRPCSDSSSRLVTS